MKKLTHDEWQAVVKKEASLLQEYLNGVTSTRDYEFDMTKLEQLKKGGSTCLDCTLGRSLPH